MRASLDPSDDEFDGSARRIAKYDRCCGAESDYRPGRWGDFREDYGVTGKEEDVEVGLIYFGKRFYAPGLQRWASADPLAVHGLGGDANLYAYVAGLALKAIDPLGLEETPSAAPAPAPAVSVPPPPAPQERAPDNWVEDDPCANGGCVLRNGPEPQYEPQPEQGAYAPPRKIDDRPANWGKLVQNQLAENAGHAVDSLVSGTPGLPIMRTPAGEAVENALRSNEPLNDAEWNITVAKKGAEITLGMLVLGPAAGAEDAATALEVEAVPDALPVVSNAARGAAAVPRSVGAAAARGAFTRIAGTRGLEHSFSRHAAQWFGREVPASTHLGQWQALVERATASGKQVAWSTGADATVGHLARIDGKYFFAQFYQGGPRAGELATAFVPKQSQLSAILGALP